MTEKENINCNLCGNNNFSIIFEAQPEKEKQFDLSEKYRSSGDESLFEQVVKCNNCGLVYINPRNKPEDILEGYSEGTDAAHVSQSEGREKTFKKTLKLINKYTKSKNRLVDIGTAGGCFLKVAKDDGWGVHGVEPNKWLCDWGKKNYDIEIKQGDIFSAEYSAEIFDVVTLWDVIEHTTDPKAVLKECKRILNPGGIIVVNIPDISSWLVRAMGRKWPFWSSVHLYYFTKKTMIKMLEELGFDIVKTKRHFQYLQVGYLAERFSQVSQFISKIACFFVKLLHIGNLQIPYYLGQTLIIGRKLI
ncbi:class I SAM-dependent methyltransferase [Candidatus Woesearchaeota archaeon]|nr:class I SAM-dependent methyltransferase [Candidatus Woesearchaeota archaeon]